MSILYYTLNNIVFKQFAFYSTASIVKLMSMAALTTMKRLSNDIYANPEDLSLARNQSVVVTTDPDVERIRRNHLNDIENIIPFVLVGFFYVATNPNRDVAFWHFRTFFISRLIHTICYQMPLPQPGRFLACSVGYLTTLSMLSPMSLVSYMINSYLNNPSYHTYLSLIKGLRQGIVYGTKIRFAHSLVQAFLFHHEPWSKRIHFIIRMTYIHGRNLGLFVFLYKTFQVIIRNIFHLSKGWSAFICAFITGYIVFQEKNSVNEQLILYLLSRIILGLIRYGQKRVGLTHIKRPIFPWVSALIWGIVLWLFQCHRETLQPSLVRSMTYLFENSNRWSSWRNFFIRDQY